MNLVDFSVDQVFYFFLIFCRIGSAITFMPAVGELFISARIKLLFALATTVILLPVIPISLDMPESAFELVLIIFSEITIGILIGFTSRMILAAIHTLGFVISYQTGLSAAMMLDPGQSSQGSLIGNMLGMMATVIILSADLHHDVLKAFIQSYQFIKINHYAEHYGDFTELFVKNMTIVWNLGIKMSIPFLTIGILMNIGGAILSRLMPQLHIFFLFLPLQILLGFFVLGITLSSLLLWFALRYKEIILNLF